MFEGNCPGIKCLGELSGWKVSGGVQVMRVSRSSCRITSYRCSGLRFVLPWLTDRQTDRQTVYDRLLSAHAAELKYLENSSIFYRDATAHVSIKATQTFALLSIAKANYSVVQYYVPVSYTHLTLPTIYSV